MATEARIKITAQDDSAAAFRKATANLDALQQSAASLGTALGSSLAVGGLTLLVKNAIDAADNLRDLSQQTGIAATTLGGLGFAATQNGGSLESVASAAGKLNKNLAEAAAGSKEALAPFQALGINIRDAAGQTKKADVVFGELADKFAQFEDGPEKAALALKIFGKAGAEQITLLNEGGAALRANIAYYERFGGVTAEVADQADRFNDTLGKLKLLGGSLSTTIAASLLPGLQAVADELLAMKENGSGFGVVGDALRTTFEAIAISAANVKFVLVGVGREAGAIAAQQGDDFALTLGELAAQHRRGRRRRIERMCEAAGDAAFQHQRAAHRLLDPQAEFFRFEFLQQIAVGAGADGGQDVGLVVGDGEDHAARLRILRFQGEQGFDAVHALHVEVDQDQVGLELLRQRNAAEPVAGFADQFHFIIGAHQLGNALAEQRVIVNQQDTDTHSLSSPESSTGTRCGGKLSTTLVPPPVRGRIASVPPSERARPLIPPRPQCPHPNRRLPR